MSIGGPAICVPEVLLVRKADAGSACSSARSGMFVATGIK